MSNPKQEYMQIYDDVAVSPACSRHSIRIKTESEEYFNNTKDYCQVPDELDIASTSHENQCPIYENVEELRGLCNNRPDSESLSCPAQARSIPTSRSKSIDTQTSPRVSYSVLPNKEPSTVTKEGLKEDLKPKKRQKSAVNMDFLKNIPPPPLGNIDKHPSLNSTTSTTSTEYSNSAPKRPLDMRPLSIPVYQMREMKERRDNQRLVMILSLLTILVFAFAFSVWYYFPDLERRYRKMTG